MRGLDEAQTLYEQYGAPMIRSRFPDWEGRLSLIHI